MMMGKAEGDRRRHDGARMEPFGQSLRQAVGNGIVGGERKVWAVLLRRADGDQGQLDGLRRLAKFRRGHFRHFIVFRHGHLSNRL
jgi:hypothetical protein